MFVEVATPPRGRENLSSSPTDGLMISINLCAPPIHLRVVGHFLTPLQTLLQRAACGLLGGDDRDALQAHRLRGSGSSTVCKSGLLCAGTN